jgi:hypothetical protein
VRLYDEKKTATSVAPKILVVVVCKVVTTDHLNVFVFGGQGVLDVNLALVNE